MEILSRNSTSHPTMLSVFLLAAVGVTYMIYDQFQHQDYEEIATLIILYGSWLISAFIFHKARTRMLKEADKRNNLQRELIEQQRFLDTIITNLPLGLFAKNAKDDYRWIMWNKKAEELFELKNEEVIGRTDYDNFPRHEADFFRTTDEAVMRGGKVIDIAAEDVTTKRGTWLAHTIKVPIVDAQGQPSVLLGIFEDITDRKRQADAQLQAYTTQLETKNTELEDARIKAEAAHNAKSQFLATMSHEIRTPLNGVIGSADLLSRTPLSGTQGEHVSTIHKSAENLLHLINDILDFTKIEAQQLEMERVSFDFSRTVEDVVTSHKPIAGRKGVELLLRYAPDTPNRLWGDPGRLRQILNNLISNALKFTQTGHVMVNVQTTAEGLLSVAVEDTGIGIPANQISRVFERFTQAESSTTRKFGGTGLGLAICKQLASLMQGDIKIESTPGKGSTFTLTIPLDADTETLRPLDLAPLKNIRVALVDDNPTNLKIMEELMLHWGCQPILFGGGHQMLDWLSAEPSNTINIAVIDHDMPAMNGGELGQQLREHHKCKNLPLIVFSSHGLVGDAQFFAARGYNGYLVKPAPPDELRAMMCTLLARPVTNEAILTRHYINEHAAVVDINARYGLRVLVVEDDLVNRKVVSMMLEEMGCQVVTAEDGAIGVEKFGESEYDLVLMDMQMPVMDGPQATRTMRAMEKQSSRTRTKIIALTANALREHLEHCIEVGMDDCLTKPLIRARLEEKLKLGKMMVV